jgi:AcrR family transcriptional regulator
MTPETASLPSRADARANRQRVLTAARECFAESVDAQMQDIARRAGVGVGTVYRHFANKEALQVALAMDCVGEMVLHARAGLEQDDPWAGLEQFVWTSTGKLSADALSVQALEESSSPDIDRGCGELRAAIVELAERARAAGALRSDLSAEQVEEILRHLAGAVRGAERSGFDWRPYVRVVLDGLRAPS